LKFPCCSRRATVGSPLKEQRQADGMKAASLQEPRSDSSANSIAVRDSRNRKLRVRRTARRASTLKDPHENIETRHRQIRCLERVMHFDGRRR